MRHTVRIVTALALTAAACGDDAPVDDDDPPDAMIAPDAGPAPVTVRLVRTTGPLADAPVAFIGPDDALLLETVTDADGEASLVVPPGTRVIATASTTARDGYLWVDPAPGEVLVAHVLYDKATTASVTIALPAVAGTTAYRIDSPCGTSDGPDANLLHTYLDTAGCARHGLLLSRWVVDQRQGTIYLPDEMMTPGGTIDAQAETWRGTVERTVGLTGLAPTVTEVSLRGQLVHDGVALTFGAYDPTTPSGGAVSRSLTLVDVPIASLQTLAGYDDGARIQVGATAAQDGAPLDVTTVQPRVIATAAYADGTLTWTSGSDGVAPDALVAYLQLGTESDTITWQVIAPPTGELALPPVPASFAQLSPAGRPVLDLTALHAVHTAGLAALRQRGFIDVTMETLVGPGQAIGFAGVAPSL